MTPNFRFAALAALTGASLMMASPAFAASTIKVAKSVTLAADPAKAWDTIHNFGGLHTWHPAVEKTELKGDDNKVGAVRMLSLKGGGVLTEVLTQYSAAGKSLTYKITDGPLPVTGYVSTMSIKPAKGGKSTMVWTSSFKAKDGTSDADAKKVIEGIYDAGFASLTQSLGS